MAKDNEKLERAEACAPRDPEPIPGFPKFGSVRLQGVYNCRDLGGMPTMDGRRIRKRRLIRSADLYDATAEDMKQLIRMHNLEYVVDLRAEYEVRSEPDPVSLMHGVEYVNLPAISNDAIGYTGLRDLSQDFKMLREFTKEPFQMLQDLYKKILLGELGHVAYKRFLNDLLETTEGATLWHCTQGKDRTGLAAIFVEYSLGVSAHDIRQDYLATNLFIKAWVDRVNSLMRNKILIRGLGADLEAYTYANMCYFDTAMDTIRNNYGTLDNYMTKALDFEPDKRKKLQELYLEKW